MFLLVPAYPGCPGPKAVKRLCVCVTNFVVCMSSDVKVMFNLLPQKNTINNLKVHVQNILTELLLRGNAIVLLHVNMQ